jgi:hypothetical protein
MTTAADSATTVPAAPPVFRARFRDRRHPLLTTGACAIAALIGLAVIPVVFVMADHTLVVEWSNALFDLAGL